MTALLLLLALQDPSVDELLAQGRYAEIKADAGGAWAFARYHLAVTGAVVEAAGKANQAGDPLGTFVLLRCHREGVGLRRDPAVMHRLNFELRKKLGEKKDLTPIEKYVASHTTMADAEGRHEEASQEKLLKARAEDDARRFQWLKEAADAGVAQAVADLGDAYREIGEYPLAFEHFVKAGELGLAEALKDQGFFLLQGAGVKKDHAKAYEVTLKAAGKGDAVAMINAAVFLDRGLAGKPDPEAAQAWIEKAAATGHWMGLNEKAVAILTGSYGYEREPARAHTALNEALKVPNRELLFKLAGFFHDGFGLEKNPAKAIEFARAAWIQGEGEAARLLEFVHTLAKNKEQTEFWQWLGNPQRWAIQHPKEKFPKLWNELHALKLTDLSVD